MVIFYPDIGNHQKHLLGKYVFYGDMSFEYWHHDTYNSNHQSDLHIS